MNRLVTRGFGPKLDTPGAAGPVTQGLGTGFVLVTVEVPVPLEERPIRLRTMGQSGTKRAMAAMDTAIVWAKLVQVQGAPPGRPIVGWIRVLVDRDASKARALGEHVASRVKSAWSEARVEVTRVPRRP